MLEEVECRHVLHRGVVHGAIGVSAVGAREAAAPREIDLDVEAAGLSIEVARLDHPRRDEAESELQQIGVAHGLSSRPVCCQHAAVLAAVKDKPSRARKCASLTATRHGGAQEKRPGRKDGSVGAEQQDGAGGRRCRRRRTDHPLNSARRHQIVAVAIDE